MNYEAGDFHKLISIGTPHRGSELATALLDDRCRPFVFGTLRGFFEFEEAPKGAENEGPAAIIQEGRRQLRTPVGRADRDQLVEIPRLVVHESPVGPGTLADP